MPLRMVFNRDDLQRIRLAPGADPLWELVLSVQQLGSSAVAPRYRRWRREVRERVGGSARAPWWLTRMFTLAPPVGSFPDFLTPPEGVADLDAGCEQLAVTSSRSFRRDVPAVFSGRPVPTWVRDLARGERKERAALVTAVRRSYRLLIAPHESRIHAVARLDRAARRARMADHGLGAVLAGIPGVTSWDGHVLQTRYPESRTVRLAGRGLTLVPSFFCWENPVTFIHPDLPPVLVYSASADQEAAAPPSVPQALVGLMGRTRAACLHALSEPHSTSRLAGALGISIGSASKHTAALREAGLVRSSRAGAAMVHRTTQLGSQLLRRGGAG